MSLTSAVEILFACLPPGPFCKPACSSALIFLSVDDIRYIEVFSEFDGPGYICFYLFMFNSV